MPDESTVTNTIRVPSTASLPIEIFQRHLDFRHVPCGDFSNIQTMQGFPERDRYVYEAYHQYLHERYEYEHEHS